jgi:hypothetical protein
LRRNAVAVGGRGPFLFSPDAQRLYVRHGSAITVLGTADGAALARYDFALVPDVVAVGPGELILLRNIPGQFRIVRPPVPPR